MIHIKKEKLEEIIKHQNEIIEDLQNELDSANSRDCDLAMRIAKAIEFIDIYTDGINLEAFDCLDLMYKIKEILERGKE